jgi:hypothetical protein
MNPRHGGDAGGSTDAPGTNPRIDDAIIRRDMLTIALDRHGEWFKMEALLEIDQHGYPEGTTRDARILSND